MNLYKIIEPVKDLSVNQIDIDVHSGIYRHEKNKGAINAPLSETEVN